MQRILKQLKIWSVIVSAFILGACEDHNTLLTLKLPPYSPQLVIQSAASPQSGAIAIILYSKPMKGSEAAIPDLPTIEVFLLENGKRIQTFEQDDAGRFSIAPENLSLKMSFPYSIEVVLSESGRSYFSEVSYLPEQPIIEMVTGQIGNLNDRSFHLRLRLGQVHHPIKAYSVQSVLLDNLGIPYKEHRLEAYLKNETLKHSEVDVWTQKDISESQDRTVIIDQNHVVYTQSSEIRVAYFSDDLARFLRDVEEINYFGEEIFHTVRPVFSNIKDGVGIFGLYQEQSSKVEIRMK